MIHQLKEDEYKRVRLLYRDLGFNLVIDSAIDGNTPAWVFVDRKDKPQTAAMWNRQDALLLAGHDANDKFNAALGEQLAQRIIPDAQQRYIPAMALYCDSDAWESRLPMILRGMCAEKATRRVYAFAGSRAGWQEQIPENSEIRRIDETLLESSDLDNIEQVAGWVRSFWRSNHAFVSTGFGYCLVEKESIASWCLSVYVSGTHYELGIATVPEYQRRGLATVTASVCVDHCERNGLTPHWHCWNDNLGSIAVAEKIGFVKPTTYFAHRFNLEQ
jgi:RimJ/RimL family protein N-acetyltransferase